jgi:hypothetical protein
MMRKKACIALIPGIMLLMIVSSARAENWVHAATADDNKVKAYVDVDSITIDGDKRRFWMYHDFKGVQSFNENPIEKAFGYDIVDCKDKTIQYTEVIIERSDGRRMKSKLIKPEVETVRPNSVNEGILEFVCNYDKEGIQSKP